MREIKNRLLERAACPPRESLGSDAVCTSFILKKKKKRRTWASGKEKIYLRDAVLETENYYSRKSDKALKRYH